MVKQLGNRSITVVARDHKCSHYELSNERSALFSIRRSSLSPFLVKHLPQWTSWIGKNGRVFRSVDHAVRSLRACNKKTFKRFCFGGDLSAPSSTFFQKVLPMTRRFGHEVKAKGRAVLVKSCRSTGLVARLAVKESHRKKLDLLDTDLLPDTKAIASDVKREFWKLLLRCKFGQNPKFRQTLLGTGDAYILALCSQSKRQNVEETGTYPVQSGFVEEGVVYGDNVMGELLSEIRDEFTPVILPSSVVK